MTRCGFLAFVFILLGVSVSQAETPRNIVWDDLLPDGASLADPLAHLDVSQRVELRLVAAARLKQARGIAGNGVYDTLTAGNLTRKLQGQGLDVEGLLAQFAVFQAQRQERHQTAAAGLNAQAVRLQGFLLPLDERNPGITEFLLVPFVASCIHEPMPPPNQVVVVHARAPFKTDALYTPVRVTGRMAVEKTTPILSLVDGTAPVAAAYALDAERIELDRDRSRPVAAAGAR